MEITNTVNTTEHGNKTTSFIKLIGTLHTAFVPDQQTGGTNLTALVRCRRSPRTDTLDYIPVLLPPQHAARLWKPGTRVMVKGTYYTYNYHTPDGKSHLIFRVRTQQIRFSQQETDLNLVMLDGYLGKEPFLRNTNFQNRQGKQGKWITEAFLAINRWTPKLISHYAPCLFWQQAAKDAASFQVGDRLVLYGNIHSRLSPKKNHTTNDPDDMIYEVSVYQYLRDGSSNRKKDRQITGGKVTTGMITAGNVIESLEEKEKESGITEKSPAVTEEPPLLNMLLKDQQIADRIRTLLEQAEDRQTTADVRQTANDS